MKMKKMMTGFLLVTLFSLMLSPLHLDRVAAEELTLQEFLKTTDSKLVKASYQYPSIKLSSNASGKSVLPAHTPITIRCSETISTKDVVSGGTVNFTVVSDVKDENGNILIKANAPVTATISFVRTKDLVGRSGEVTVSDFHTRAVDGTYVPLSGSVSAKPDEKIVLSVVLSVLICPLFLLMKGDEAQVQAGTTKAAYTISDVYIKPANLL